MVLENFDSIPEVTLPDGFRLVRTGDGATWWMQLLNENGELGRWDEKRVADAFQGNSRVWSESVHFIVREDVPVATACVQVHTDSPDRPELGWIAVSPGFRGKRLGFAVTVAVLHFMRSNGFGQCFLRTDDERLPGIKLYLSLGFRPEMTDPSHPGRWKRIMSELQGTQAGDLLRNRLQ